MFIDVILMILLIISIIKGFKNGFIVAVFSFFAIIIGLAAAVKTSAWVAGWLSQTTNIHSAWLPFLAFLLVMVGVFILVRLGALFLQTIVNLVMMGWLNKISGIILYALLYISVFSVLLFYADKIHLLNQATINSSYSYPIIKNWGPKSIELFAQIIPFFKGMFADLTLFFNRLSTNIN